MQRPARPLRLRRMARRRCSRHEDSRSSGGQPGTRATRRATTPRFAAIMRYLPDSKTSANRCFLGAGSETAWGQRATKGRQMEARRADDLMRRPPPRRDGSTWAAGVNVGQPRLRNRCTRIVSRSPRCTRHAVWCPTPSANMLRTASFRRGRDGAGFQRCRVVIDPGMNHEQVSGWSASCSDGPCQCRVSGRDGPAALGEQWAGELAERLLKPLGRRWQHTLGVVSRARSVERLLDQHEAGS